MGISKSPVVDTDKDLLSKILIYHHFKKGSKRIKEYRIKAIIERKKYVLRLSYSLFV